MRPLPVTHAEETARVTGRDDRVSATDRVIGSAISGSRHGWRMSAVGRCGCVDRPQELLETRLRLRSTGWCGKLEQVADGHRTEIAMEVRIEIVGIGHSVPEDPTEDGGQRPNQGQGLTPSRGIPEPVLQR